MQKPSEHAPPYRQNSDITGYLYRLAHGKAKYDPDIDKHLDDIHYRVSSIAEDFQAYRAAEKDRRIHGKTGVVDVPPEMTVGLWSLASL